MKILTVCDSTYGNTEKIAKAINNEFSVTNNANLLRVYEVKPGDLNSVDLLVLGSPTQGGRPTPGMQGLLDSIPQNTLISTKVATFDTRFVEEKQNFALRLLMKTIGYSADKMMRQLMKKGGSKLMEPMGFFVGGREGPLLTGELNRASNWAKDILGNI